MTLNLDGLFCWLSSMGQNELFYQFKNMSYLMFVNQI